MSVQPKQKNWFKRHKILTTIIVFVILIAIAGSASDKKTDSSNGGSSSTSSSAKTYRFADRADKQSKDIEVLPNEAATVGKVKMTIANAEYKTAMSQYETADSGKTYVVADVTLENTDTKTHPYNVFDFRIQTASGQVLDGSFASVANPLHSGDLVAGGKVTGQVVFEVPDEAGHQYIIWKPGLASDRAIVQVK